MIVYRCLITLFTLSAQVEVAHCIIKSFVHSKTQAIQILFPCSLPNSHIFLSIPMGKRCQPVADGVLSGWVLWCSFSLCGRCLRQGPGSAKKPCSLAKLRSQSVNLLLEDLEGIRDSWNGSSWLLVVLEVGDFNVNLKLPFTCSLRSCWALKSHSDPYVCGVAGYFFVQTSFFQAPLGAISHGCRGAWRSTKYEMMYSISLAFSLVYGVMLEENPLKWLR